MNAEKYSIESFIEHYETKGLIYELYENGELVLRHIKHPNGGKWEFTHGSSMVNHDNPKNTGRTIDNPEQHLVTLKATKTKSRKLANISILYPDGTSMYRDITNKQLEECAAKLDEYVAYVYSNLLLFQMTYTR